MLIKKIKLYNFRIYKGVNEVCFDADDEKNIHIISGYNGYGKTTFLTSLVWCLYGGQMQDVEDSFRRRIREVGGYSKFLEGCLNRAAASELDDTYSVSILFSSLRISGLIANEVEVKRSFTVGDKSDQLEIYIDGQKNELVQDIGNDIFVQDFILPKEIAKFFFFDAEKITSLADNQSADERRQLGKAYAEVLGIKKYVDLRNNLAELRLKYKKESASSIDTERYIQLEKLVSVIEQDLDLCEKSRSEKKLRLTEIEDQIVVLQTRLWRLGTSLDYDDMIKLKSKKEDLQKVSEVLKETFKMLLEFAPFAMAGRLFFETLKSSGSKLEGSELHELTSATLNDLRNDFAKFIESLPQTIEKSIVNPEFVAFLDRLDTLRAVDLVRNGRRNLSESAYSEMAAIGRQLRFTYRDEFKRLNTELKRNRYELNEVSKKLSQAESKENDSSVKHLQLKLGSVQNLKKLLQHEIDEETVKIVNLTNDLNVQRKVLSEFQRKISVKDDLRDKDDTAVRLIRRLDKFIVSIQNEKQHLLEKTIADCLNRLMHKQRFVKLVSIRIEGEIIDIDLLSERGDKINKEELSMGEKQLYATAIFQALVKESKIEFPVFIDSPMQKLDMSHAQNILREFYPRVSKQVVILPLLNKEFSKSEFEIIEDNVKSCHLIIHDRSEESSTIRRTSNENLFSIMSPSKMIKSDV